MLFHFLTIGQERTVRARMVIRRPFAEVSGNAWPLNRKISRTESVFLHLGLLKQCVTDCSVRSMVRQSIASQLRSFRQQPKYPKLIGSFSLE